MYKKTLKGPTQQRQRPDPASIQYNSLLLGQALVNGQWAGPLLNVEITALQQTLGDATSSGVHIGTDGAANNGTPFRPMLYGENTRVSANGVDSLNSVETETTNNYVFKGQTITDTITVGYRHLSSIPGNIVENMVVNNQNMILGFTGDTGSPGSYHLHTDLMGQWTGQNNRSLQGSPLLTLLAMQTSQTGGYQIIDTVNNAMRTNMYLVKNMNTQQQKIYYDPYRLFLQRPNMASSGYTVRTDAYVYTNNYAQQLPTIQSALQRGMNPYNFWEYNF